MDGWWEGAKIGLRVAYSNKKMILDLSRTKDVVLIFSEHLNELVALQWDHGSSETGLE